MRSTKVIYTNFWSSPACRFRRSRRVFYFVLSMSELIAVKLESSLFESSPAKFHRQKQEEFKFVEKNQQIWNCQLRLWHKVCFIWNTSKCFPGELHQMKKHRFNEVAIYTLLMCKIITQYFVDVKLLTNTMTGQEIFFLRILCKSWPKKWNCRVLMFFICKLGQTASSYLTWGAAGSWISPNTRR